MARVTFCQACESWHDPMVGRCPPEERRITEAPSRAAQEEAELSRSKTTKPASEPGRRTAEMQTTEIVEHLFEKRLRELEEAVSRIRHAGRIVAPGKAITSIDTAGVPDRIGAIESALGMLDGKFDALEEQLEPLTELATATIRARKAARDRQDKRRGKPHPVADAD